jgi:hypothetical protein
MKLKETHKTNIIKTGKKVEKFVSIERKVTELTQLDFVLNTNLENMESVIASYSNNTGVPIIGTFKLKFDLPLYLMSRYGCLRIRIITGIAGFMNSVLCKELHKLSDSHLFNIELPPGDAIQIYLFTDKTIQIKDIVFRIVKMKSTLEDKSIKVCTINNEVIEVYEKIILYTEFVQSKKSPIIYDYMIPYGYIFIVREIVGATKELNAFIDTKRLYKACDIISVPTTAIDKKFSLIVDACKIVRPPTVYPDSSNGAGSYKRIMKKMNKKTKSKKKKVIYDKSFDTPNPNRGGVDING